MTGPRIGRACAAGTVALAVALSSCARPASPPQAVTSPGATATTRTSETVPPIVAPDVDVTSIAGLVDADIAEHRLPGAVIQIGHRGTIVLRQAYGWRNLPGEPGLDGMPGPGEAMTPDTIFDMASLTKLLATTPAVLQLYEQGKVAIDDPVQTYLPDFNPTGDPRRAQVTVRMLLTHSSGIGGDLSRQGPWGVVAADRADGLRRALTAPLEFDPGQTFHYSDIGYILLGEIVERITGEQIDVYAHDHIFAPLGMTDTRYIPAAKACGPYRIRGNAIAVDAEAPPVDPCPEGTWSTDLLPRVAPTSRDEDTAGLNPDFDYPLRGTVHDPTARRMGGVAGSAGVFSTAPDVGRFAQALLDRLAGRPSVFPLRQATVAMMTAPQQPPSVDNGVRGFGWDIDTYQSTPRGDIFPVGGFGHTGFTGVSIWLDPGSDTYVIVLANVIHQRGGPPISTLSGEVATAAARALHLYGS